MTTGSKDAFGDRMKAYEASTTALLFDPEMPLCARVDGRSFSTFTHGMKRPFDEDMSRLMQKVAVALVEKTGARCAFTQSDEISLLFHASDMPDSRIFFGGRQFKVISVLAAMASAIFAVEASKLWPERCERGLPVFDARAFQVPNRSEAASVFLWRYLDCERNAIQMVAQSLFPHRDLQGKNIRTQLAMIEAAGVSMEAFPDFFKHGSFVRRTTEIRMLSDDEIEKIPEAHRPSGPIPRSTTTLESIPVRKLANLEDYLFVGEDADLGRDQVGWSQPSAFAAVP